MPKHDNSVKNWLGKNARFADLFNHVLFQGKPIIKKEELSDIRNESDLIIQDKNKKIKTSTRYRDIVKQWKNDITFVILATEIQENIHYAMPVRNMLYDALAYTDQARKLWEQLDDAQKKQVSQQEFLSSFRKEDRLSPVITLVFYYGDSPWDGALELHDMFGNFAKQKWIQEWIPNYKINLINPLNISDFDDFQSDLQIIFPMLQRKNNKQDLLNYINTHRAYFECVNTEDAYAISALLGTTKHLKTMFNSRKEKQNMCKALQEFYEDGVNEGKEKGKAEERIIGIKKSILMLQNVGATNEKILELIMTEYELKQEDAEHFITSANP